jgi:hypothetical protein
MHEASRYISLRSMLFIPSQPKNAIEPMPSSVKLLHAWNVVNLHFWSHESSWGVAVL